ncbi:MAG TPA: DUF1877 family protein [Pirellulaceae bacterium]|nr:DUF1877 family protein [Pirellulaceae bacterium]
MVGNGYLISLTREHAKRLFGQQDDDQLRQFLAELRSARDLKESGRILELLTLWDPLHRCLTDGELDPAGGEAPLNHAILGGRQLHRGNDYIAAMVRPDMANFVAEALSHVKEDELRQKFFGLNAESYGRPIDEKQFMEVWIALRNMRILYEAAAENLEAVVFAGELQEGSAS